MDIKNCIRCKLDFNAYCENKKTGKIASVCIECKRKYDRDYYYNNPEKRKVLKIEQQKKRREIVRDYIFNLLIDSECIDCGEKNILTLDFDHIDNKEFGIANHLQGDYSLNKIKTEIKKCEIRCANCHRIKTASQLGHWKINYLNRDMG